MMPARRHLLAAAAMAPLAASSDTPRLDAPNVVEISPALVTSGQPGAASLARLAALGFGADIDLAPFSVPDAVKDERSIVERQGLVFVDIPIAFGRPTEADFGAFVDAMARVAGRRTLVHCQVNMRASSMVFLHRVVVGHEAPEHAYEAVARVWSPEGPWKALIVTVLRKHGIGFEPY